MAAGTSQMPVQSWVPSGRVKSWPTTPESHEPTNMPAPRVNTACRPWAEARSDSPANLSTYMRPITKMKS